MHRVMRRLLQLFSRKSPEEFVRSLGVRFGEGCRFIAPTASTFSSEPYLIKLGDHVEVSGNVRFMPHDGAVWVFRELEPEIDFMLPIEVGNNVFIGNSSIILPGAKIGNNCIIGAGSVVKGEVPSNSVVAGVPARVIRTIGEYREKIGPHLVNTKSMSREEKKRYLMRHFGL